MGDGIYVKGVKITIETMSDRLQVDEAPKYIRIVTDPIGRAFIRLKTSKERLREYQTVNTDSLSEERAREARERSKKEVEQTKSDFLNALAWRTMWYVLTIAVLMTILILLQYGNVISGTILTYGLTIEVIGASILGRGLISSPVEILEKAATPYGGPTPYLRKTLAVDVVDGMWGISLIIAGAAVSGVSTIHII